jgi:hypothetical protein
MQTSHNYVDNYVDTFSTIRQLNDSVRFVIRSLFIPKKKNIRNEILFPFRQVLFQVSCGEECRLRVEEGGPRASPTQRHFRIARLQRMGFTTKLLHFLCT